jgi:hypothetical protein
VIVFDTDNEVAKSVLLRVAPELDQTRQIRTPRGIHYYCKHPQGPRIQNSASKLGDGIDVRADGGYVIIPPSTVASGTYSWVNPNAPIIPVPDSLWSALLAGGPLAASDSSKTEGVSKGSRNTHLTHRAGQLQRLNFPLDAVYAAIWLENLKRCTPPLLEAEVKQIVNSVTRYPPGTFVPPTIADREPNLVCLASVLPEPVEWLIWPYLPLRKLTVCEGDPGEGKTYAALAMCASITCGRVPISGENGHAPANVLYLTAEDDPRDTLRPRFDSLGGDPQHFHVLRDTKCGCDGKQEYGPLWLTDIAMIERALELTRPVLVVVDPLQGFLGAEVDFHRANEVRPVLANLARLAERFDCAFIIVRHLSKGAQSRALYRGLGSVDIVAAARSVLLAGHVPHDPTQRALVHLKSSCAPLGPAVGYRLDEKGFAWTGVSQLSAGDLLAPEEMGSKSALDEAKEFIRTTLSGGSKPTRMVEQSAKQQDISLITLRRAAKLLGVRRRPSGFKGEWTMELPNSQLMIPAMEEQDT